MNQPAKANEPSMEEILASIRRIIADDEGAKPAAKAAPAKEAAPPPPKPAPPKAAPAPAPAMSQMNQDAIDAVLADFDKPAPAAPPPAPAADVLELTEAMAARDPEPGFRAIDAMSDLAFSETAEPTPPPPAPSSPPPVAVPHPAAVDQGLLSSATTDAVNSAFNMLAQTVLTPNARTLEDLVKEMLRPMLKGWLDDNLPNLVERLVRAEIERVSRGRG